MMPHPVRIGVVGGNGQMGRWLRRFWQGLGYQVIFSDRDTLLDNTTLARTTDLIFVAVGLQGTPEVIRALAPLISPDAALVSIASLMTPSAEALAEVAGESLCAHPVFGPTVNGTAGLPVVIAPVRGERWSPWLASILREQGFAVRLSTPGEHDAAMAVVQAMLHSLYVALCAAMGQAGLAPVEALTWASPTMRMQLGLIARILGQDANLYADLVVGNALAPAVLEGLATSLQDLAALARSGDRAGFSAAFRQAREGFGDEGATLAAQAESALAGLQ